jgi:endonuclease YncB( thermonuclease family)
VRVLRQLLSLALALGLAAAVVRLVGPAQRYVEGPIRVIDGDSLEVAGMEIRLSGVDAPELRQPCRRGGSPYACGEVARAALRDATAGRPVSCRVAGHDRYGRQLAHCSVAGQDLGALLVGRGLALGYGSYQREEQAARAGSLGLWAGEFELPSEWRRAHPRR